MDDLGSVNDLRIVDRSGHTNSFELVVRSDQIEVVQRALILSTPWQLVERLGRVLVELAVPKTLER